MSIIAQRLRNVKRKFVNNPQATTVASPQIPPNFFRKIPKKQNFQANFHKNANSAQKTAQKTPFCWTIWRGKLQAGHWRREKTLFEMVFRTPSYTARNHG